MHRVAVVLLILAVLSVGSAGAQGRGSAPVASAAAWAVRVAVPGTAAVTTQTAAAPPGAAFATGGPFSYPDDGSTVAVQSISANATTTVTANASALGEATAAGISLFGGEITLAAVTARASAGTGQADAGGNFDGSQATGLVIAGQPTSARHVVLGDWGTLTLGAQTVDTTAPAGAHGYRGEVTELDLYLNAEHDGLPAGSEIQIGFARAAVQTTPETATPTTTTTPAAIEPSGEPPVGDRPQLLPKSHPAATGARHAHPKLTAGGYVFPVYGQSSYANSFGMRRADVTYHHGDDIFGQLGEPLVACASGTVFSVGWNKVGGNRLWIRDSAGNEFYYAHLSAFSNLTADGAHVKAGQGVGFMGNTGDAEGTPVHLHFEIHPVSLLYLGYDGAVNPTRYLAAWQHAKDIPFAVGAGWAPPVPGRGAAPEPGAMLLGMSDISSADGLDPASLRHALQPPKQLLQTLVPTPIPPGGDLGVQAGAGA